MDVFKSRKTTSPREEARAITEGEEKPHHIGKKTNAVLQQEFYQLMINWNPNRTTEELVKYRHELRSNIRALTKQGIISSIMSKYSSHIEAEFNAEIKKIQNEHYDTNK